MCIVTTIIYILLLTQTQSSLRLLLLLFIIHVLNVIKMGIVIAIKNHDYYIYYVIATSLTIYRFINFIININATFLTTKLTLTTIIIAIIAKIPFILVEFLVIYITIKTFVVIIIFINIRSILFYYLSISFCIYHLQFYYKSTLPYPSMSTNTFTITITTTIT